MQEGNALDYVLSCFLLIPRGQVETQSQCTNKKKESKKSHNHTLKWVQNINSSFPTPVRARAINSIKKQGFISSTSEDGDIHHVMVSKKPSVQCDGTSQSLAQHVELFQFWSISRLTSEGRHQFFGLSAAKCYFLSTRMNNAVGEQALYIEDTSNTVWPGRLDLLSSWGWVLQLWLAE